MGKVKPLIREKYKSIKDDSALTIEELKDNSQIADENIKNLRRYL